MIVEEGEGSLQFQDQPAHGDIGIKGDQDYNPQQQGPYPQPGYDPSYQPPMSPPGPYYPPGTKSKFPLIPVSPYSRGLALSVVMMVVGAIIEKFFLRGDYYYSDFVRNPFFYFGMVLFYIGGIMAFLFTLGLFHLPSRQDQSTNGSSNVHLGLAFLLGAIILALALH
jgi:hypothetical protein